MRSTNGIPAESEPRAPSTASLDLLDRFGARIRPDEASLGAWFEAYRSRHRERLGADLDLLQRQVDPRARVLELGAVPLLLTAAIDALDYRVSGVDLAPQRFATAIRELALDVRACDIETAALPFADATFDAALFNELFEHLRIDPIFTLGEVQRVLKPGGKLLLSTPNLRSFRGLRNLLLRNQGHAASGGVYAQYEKLRRLGHMGHVREYTTREVVEFLERTGFHTRRVVFRGGHGAGLVGIAERCAPSMRPFFTVIAARSTMPAAGDSPISASSAARARR